MTKYFCVTEEEQINSYFNGMDLPFRIIRMIALDLEYIFLFFLIFCYKI